MHTATACRAALLTIVGAMGGIPSPGNGAVAARDVLEADYAQLRPELQRSPFGLPLHLQSEEREDAVNGVVHAVIPHALGDLRRELRTLVQWCEVLILHLNVHQCRAVPPSSLSLLMGRKGETAADADVPLDLTLTVAQSSANRFEVRMEAEDGPFGTRDYELDIQAMPVGEAQSFLRLSYSYSMSGAARLASSTYFRTAARDKVGFTVTGRTRSGEPEYIRGIRGALERNAMRYYLALDTWLDSRKPGRQMDRRARFLHWYRGTQRYPQQLGEVTLDEYLESKQPLLAQRAGGSRGGG